MSGAAESIVRALQRVGRPLNVLELARKTGASVDATAWEAMQLEGDGRIVWTHDGPHPGFVLRGETVS